MVQYLWMFPTADVQIDFMRKYPKTILNYIEGNPPAREQGSISKLLGIKAAIPKNWPTEEPRALELEITHRNVSLYHLLLNGTQDSTSGAGSIFQTWFMDTHDAIDLSGYGEEFAFYARQIPELLHIVERVKPEDIQPRFSQWLRKQGDEREPTPEECRELWQSIDNLRQGAAQTVTDKLGLIWVSR